MTYSLTWLADALRNGGCNVIEQPNWKSAGQGDMGTAKGVLCHHTAGPKTGDHPSLGTVEHGRKAGPGVTALAGPLSHLLLARDGTFYVLAAGRCNHAGAGSWQGVTTGNSSFIGIEAENAGDGTDPWPQVQMDAYAKGVAAILKHIGAPAIMCAGHKEYAIPRGRKIDPSFDMAAFRMNVADYMIGALSSAHPHVTTDPAHAMIKRGDHGSDVMLLQSKLGVAEDADFGPETERVLRDFQTAHGLTADGLVGPKTWAALG